jgi:ubiquinone/menaquinone biosynthesis C-methylase UbiE
VPTPGTRLADEFDRAAPRYDLLTALNPGYTGALRDAARRLTARLPRRDGWPTLWDLGCGSGLSTRALLEAAGPEARIVGLDASAGMLAQAQEKSWPDGVTFVQALAQDLPDVARLQLDGPADGAFAAYLLRNVPVDQRDATVQAIADQVRPGGWIALQDYHVKGSPAAQAVWTGVCWGVVTPLSVAVRGNPSIYRYLWRSVLDNDSTAELEARLRRAGLTDVTWSTVGGWQHGILHTVLARKPL